MQPKKHKIETALPPMPAKQAQFCREYLVDLNAAEAAKRAGYSAATATQAAWRMMQDPRTQAEISALMAERNKRTEITVDRVVNELAKVAFGDIRKVLSWKDGSVSVKNSDELDAESAAMIAGAEGKVSEFGNTVKLSMND